MDSKEAASATELWSPRQALGGGMVAIFSGQMLSYVLSFAAIPLLTALYSMADFAALGIFSGVITIASVASSLCYQKVIPLVRTDRQAINAMAISLVLATVTSIGIWAIAVASARWWGPWFELEWLVDDLPLLIITLWVSAYQQVLLSWCVRRQAYRIVSGSRVGLTVMRVATQLGCGVVLPGPLGLLWGFAAGQLVGALWVTCQVWPEGQLIHQIRWSRMQQVLYAYREFAWFATLPEIFQRMAICLPGVLLAVTYNYEVAGAYVFVQRLFGVPATVLHQVISKVYVGVAARTVVEKENCIPQLFEYVFYRLIWLTAPPHVVVLFLAPTVFPWIFGAGWATAGIYCSILVPQFFVWLVYECLRPTVDLLQQPRLYLLGSLMVLAGLLLGLGIPLLCSWSAIAAMISLSACVTVAQAIALYHIWRAVDSYSMCRRGQPRRLSVEVTSCPVDLSHRELSEIRLTSAEGRSLAG